MENKRELILKAALKQFAEEGYNQATMQSIAKRAGVGKGTTYEYFSSKEALFSEVMNNGLTYILKALTIELQKPGSVYEKMKRLFIKQVELYRSEVELRNIMLNDFGNIPKQFHEQFVKKQKEIIQEMDKAVQEGIKSGEIVNADSQMIATHLLNSLKVIIIQITKEDIELNESVEQLLTILFDGLTERN